MRDILERAAQSVAARKKQQEEARAKLVQAPSSSGFKNAVQDALQRKQEAQARAEALRQLVGQSTRKPAAQTVSPMERRMAAAIEREGSLPDGTRWLNQGDKAVIVRDFAHKPIAGVESAPRANAGMNAERDYRAAVARANEAFVAPVDKYGTTYGSMHDTYMKGKDAVERGETDPEYAAYHARMGEMLAEGDRIHEEAEALRPEWMQDETLRAAYEGGAQTTTGGWDKRNYYDEIPGMTQQIFDDYNKASAQRDQLAAQIQQLEAAGMGNTPNLAKMREQLAGMDEQLTQMGYTKLDWGEDFLSVLENGRQNGWNNADSELLQTVLNPDAAIQRAAETHAGTGQIPISKEADRASWMNEKERNRFLYLWQTKGEEAATEYFNSLEHTLTQRKATGLQQRAYDTANSSALGAVGMTALDILATPVKGLGTLSTGINALLGKKSDPYGDAFLLNHMGSGAVAGAKDLAVSPFLGEGGKETLASKIAGIGFDALQSGANSLGNAVVYGPLGLVGMGLASSGDTTVDSLIRSGGKSGISALNGIITGAGEILTEAIPMDMIGNMLAGKTKGIGSVLLHSLTDAPGEMLSTIIGEVSDRSVMGAYSGYQQAINSGVSPETATKEFWNEVAYSGLLGWLSAAGSGVTAQTIGKITQPRQQEAPSRLQQGIDRFRARQDAPVAAQNGQQPPSAQTGEETGGSAADRLKTAAQAVAEGEQKAAEEAKPVQFAQSAEGADSTSGKRFAQPMAAQTVDGDSVQVLGIEQDTDGKPYLRIVDENGERTEPIEAVAFEDDTVQDLLTADGVRGLGGEALTKYLADYDGSVPVEAYAEAYGYVYRRGAANATFADATGNVTREILPESAQIDAYTAGLSKYHLAAGANPAAQQTTQPAAQQNAQPAVKGGVVRSFTEAGWRSMSREQRRAATMQIELMDAMGRRFGRQIKVVDSLQTPDGQSINGRYNMQTGEIEISLKADAGAYSYVAMHELTHAIKNEKGKAWATFSGAVTDALMEQGQDVDALIQYQMDKFGYDAETAMEEVVCNTAPAMLQNKEVLLDLYRKDRTLFERVRDWVKQMIADIQQAGKTLAERSQSWAQMDALAEYRDTAKQLLSMMDEIFQADGESVAEAPVGWTEGMIEQEIVEGMTPSVMEAPVDAEGNAVRYSVSTYEQEMPKPMGVARAKFLGFDTRSKKDGGSIARLGRNGKRTLMASGRDVTEHLIRSTMERKEIKEGMTQKQKDAVHDKINKTVKKVLGYMDDVSKWFKKNVGRYEYVNLAEVNDADIIIDRKTGQILFSCQVPNGEYKVNFDFTTVCRQREAVQRFVDELSREKGKHGSKLEDISLTKDNIFKLNTMLKNAGYETACLGCFVEAKRYRIMSQANTIIEEWNAAVRALNPNAEYFGFASEDYNPSKDEIIKLDESMSKYTNKGSGAKTPTQRAQTLIKKVPEMQKLLRPSDIISREGRRAIREFNPQLESFLLSRFGNAGAKPAVGFMPYNSEIAALPETKKVDGKTYSYAEYLANMGGGRTNSFSDFVITHALDYLQRTIDMAARGFTGQCYTKVLGRAMLYGMTGEKVNMSVMFDIDPDLHWSNAGLDADGNYIVADKARADRMEAEGKERTFTQSIPFAEAVAIEHDPRYAENCGIIGVGYSYNHIKKMIDDGDIPYIIPYHRSRMPDSVAKANHTAHATNYEAVQNTTKIVGYARVRNMGESNGVPSYATWPEGKKDSRKVKGMTFDFAEAMKRTGSATAAMQEWLKWMSDNQLTPVTESGEAGHGKFQLYETLEKTKSPEKTADAYIRYCFEQGMAPVFFEFAGMDGYYKTLFDFSVKNLVTGETSLQKPMSFDFMDEMPVEEFIGEMEREMGEYRDYMKSRYGEGSDWAKIKQQAYEEMQPQDGDDVWANSMSDYDADANAAEVALGGVMQMTGSHMITSAEADTVARRAIAAVGSTVDMSELAEDIWDAFAIAGRMGSADLYAEMMPIAKRVLDNSARRDKAHASETAELRKMLKSVTVALTPAQKAMAAEISGSYVAYKRAARGLSMSLTRGTSLDTLYSRLTAYDADAYPAGATDQQKLEALLSASDSVQTVYLTGMQENESIRWMADKMINSYYSLESVQRDVRPIVPEDVRKGTEAPTDFAMMLRMYRNAIGAYEKTSHALFDEALHNVMERYGRKVSTGEPYDIAKETATDEGKALYRRVLSEQRKTWRLRMEEGQQRMTAVEQIKRQTADLVKRLEDPTDKKHVQDHLRRAVSAFLSGLDLGGKTKVARNLSERIAVLATVMQNEARDSDSDIEYVFDPGMIEELQELARQIEELPSMADMTIEQLQVLRMAVAHVHHVVVNADMMLDETGKHRVSQLAAQTVADLADRKDVKYRTGLNKKIHDMLSIGQLDSFHFFDLLGESGKKLFAGLRNGLDRRITHEADAIEYANAAMDQLPKEQRKALQQELAKGKHAKRTTFQVSGGEVELTRGQIMNLYLTSKRKAAQLHLYGTKENRGRSGIRFGEDSKARSVAISSEDVQRITDTLTAEEKQLADTLQRYLATECAKWGNETSRRLFGYSKYAEPDYWPMRVDSETVRRKSTEESEKSHGDNLYAIAHMGFTHKLTPRSFNALYMDDVFSVFSKHVAQVAAYNAFAPASLDIGRWYNVMDDGGGGVRRSLEVKFGSAAKEYIPRLLVDLNGSGDRSYNPGLTDKMFGYAKSGAVGRNLRVIIQQPTAIMRAGDMMGYQHITAGMLDPRKPGDRTKLKEAVELAAKYSPIAKLKQMGFFETNIGSGLKTKMFDDRTAIDKVKDEGMWLAGKMDEMTFGMLWRACESETRKLHPELTEGSEEFYRTVGKRLSDVIDYTQVVDSPLHRSQLMRSSHFGAKLATNFLAEPTKTYNMLVSNLRNYVANRKDPVAKKKFVRTLGVFTMTSVVTAMAQSLIDAIRSDEDEEWWRKFLTAFAGDYSKLGDKPLEKVVNAARQALLEGNVGGTMNVGNMIPYVKDVLSLMQGWDLKRTDMQSVEKLIQTGEQVYKLALGENTTSGWGWAKSIASSVDAVTGLGIGNALRDGYAVTNLLFESFGAESPVNMKTEDATSTMAYDNLYKALTSGNEADWRRLMSKMLAKGKSEKDIHSAMAERLAEDERIVAAYGHKATGNSREVDRIRREMIAELPGWMGEKRRTEIVDKAINSRAPKTTTTKPDGDLNSKLYTTTDIGVVLVGWAKGTHTKEDYDLIISELVGDSTAANPEKTVLTNAKSQAKAVYKAATAADRKRLGEIIKELFGLTDKDLEKWLDK